jgi:DNA-binding transcriptional ArsR family regulator
VLTRGVDPTLCCYYKSSRIKQYFKEGRALRTETVICDTRDFGIGRRVCAKNWDALRAVGESANRRLCDAETAVALPNPDVATFEQVTRPSLTLDGLYAPALRFGDHRVMAVLGSLITFCHIAAGFSNGQLVSQVCALGETSYTKRQATYDLRRLKRKGLIQKQPKSRRYQLTALGRRVGVLFTKTYCRVLTPGLTALDTTLPPEFTRRSRLGIAWSRFEHALTKHLQDALIAA